MCAVVDSLVEYFFNIGVVPLEFGLPLLVIFMGIDEKNNHVLNFIYYITYQNNNFNPHLMHIRIHIQAFP